MSKNTTSPLARIVKTSAKIAYFEEKIKQKTGKRRHHIHLQINCLKRALKHYSKLYVWGVQGKTSKCGSKRKNKLLLAA